MFRIRVIPFLALAGLFLGLITAVSAEAANPIVVLKTSKGEITVELFADKAPLTVGNFLSYVDAKFYDGTIFHRVIKNFMIQGGGLTAAFVEKPQKPPIRNEAANRLKNLRGTLAMARSDAPHSATSQFFINHKNNADLDHKNTTADGFGYCVFGQVLKGMDVVDAIASVPVGIVKGYEDAPRQTITIESVRRQAQ
jgi:cyclophilin family peptidyl-prolyl cis-trans isomerase